MIHRRVWLSRARTHTDEERFREVSVRIVKLGSPQ